MTDPLDPVAPLINEAYAVEAVRPLMERIHLRSGQALRREIGLHEANLAISADNAEVTAVVNGIGRHCEPTIEAAATTLEATASTLRLISEIGMTVDERLVGEILTALSRACEQVIAAAVEGGRR